MVSPPKTAGKHILPDDDPAGDFLRLAARRRSCRTYRSVPVPRERIEKLIEAARLAPSACNRQPWRFAVVTEEETRQALAREGILPGLSMEWIADAPVVIAMGIRASTVTHSVAPLFSGVDYAWMDVGIAGEHLVLEATQQGLGSCWIGWIRPAKVRNIVRWPHDVKPAALITIGWPAAEETPPRPRLPPDQITTWI
ncbi:MAG: nitroreductase family protein [Lentisphaerae bacterium]|nr:nitroreductase family protein [Lentisphaerota bacterium]